MSGVGWFRRSSRGAAGQWPTDDWISRAKSAAIGAADTTSLCSAQNYAKTAAIEHRYADEHAGVGAVGEEMKQEENGERVDHGRHRQREKQTLREGPVRA